jgi:benzoyl-CoA reductase/2-hydroxyglutaryl-CoA dehydratase subunit BcrC/BadD/HgdB
MTVNNSSEIKRRCDSRLFTELEELRQFRSKGGKVAGYTCHMFPAAVAAGLDLWPVRVLCGATSDSESAGERMVRADVCPHVKSLIGNVLDRKSLHAQIDLWIGLQTCDQMRRGMDVITGRLGKEVHPIQVPATRTPEAKEYYAFQIKRFVSDIEARYGVTYCDEHALKWRHAQEKAASVLSKAARSGSVSPTDLHAMFHLYFVARPFGLADFIEEAIDASEVFSPSRKIILAGSPLAAEDTVLLEELEFGKISVIPLNCTGLNTVEYADGTSFGDDLVSSLAYSAFNLPPCIRSRPNRDVYDRIGEAISQTGASGLIVKSLKFCDLWYTERERIRKSFDIPVLVFDSDYAAGGRERIATRIEAFLEMLR